MMANLLRADGYKVVSAYIYFDTSIKNMLAPKKGGLAYF